MAAKNVNNLNLLWAFYDYDGAKQFFRNLTTILAPGDEAIITFLVLEGMRHIEEEVKRRQLVFDTDTEAYLNRVMQKCHNSLCHPRYRHVYVRWLKFYYALNLTEPDAHLKSGIDFLSDDKRDAMFESLVEASKADPLVAVLGLQGLHCIGYNFELEGMPLELGSANYLVIFREFLENWRCNSPFWDYDAFIFGSKPIPKILRSLTIFRVLKVPLFIDDYGKRWFAESLFDSEEIELVGDTPIFHVTHQKEAELIQTEEKLEPSNAKNIISGVWFGISSDSSVYGSVAFPTTLSALGVTGLRQGEVVRYKNEVNVILYAVGFDDCQANYTGLMKPKEEELKRKNPSAYVSVSIFVPARFLDNFNVEHYEAIEHAPFCVKEKRGRSRTYCNELSFTN